MFCAAWPWYCGSLLSTVTASVPLCCFSTTVSSTALMVTVCGWFQLPLLKLNCVGLLPSCVPPARRTVTAAVGAADRLMAKLALAPPSATRVLAGASTTRAGLVTTIVVSLKAMLSMLVARTVWPLYSPLRPVTTSTGLAAVGSVMLNSDWRAKNTSVSLPAPPSTVSLPPWPSMRSAAAVPSSESPAAEPKTLLVLFTSSGRVWFCVKASVSTFTVLMRWPAYSKLLSAPRMRVMPATVVTVKASRGPNSTSVSAPAPPSMKSLPPRPSMRSAPAVPVMRSACGVPSSGARLLVVSDSVPLLCVSRSTFHSRLTEKACSPAAKLPRTAVSPLMVLIDRLAAAVRNTAVSVPAPPLMRSLPPRPYSVSLPAVPLRLSPSGVPLMAPAGTPGVPCAVCAVSVRR